MVDETKDGNVRPIRKGLEIPKGEKLAPLEDLVIITGLLHKMALNGTLRDLAFVGITPDLSEFRICGIKGEGYNFALMDTMLRHLVTIHYEDAVFPILMGDWEDDEDE